LLAKKLGLFLSCDEDDSWSEECGVNGH